MQTQSTDSELTIRQMTSKDVREAWEIECKVFTSAFDLEKMEGMRKWFPPGCFIAIKSKMMVGFILSMLRKSQLGHIISIAVHPEYHRQGIGTELVKRSMSVFRQQRVTGIRLEVNVENRGAISLYRSLGFRVDQRIPDYYLDGGDAYVMFHQELSSPDP